MSWNELGGGARFLLVNISQIVGSSARFEEKSSYFGHVKIHGRIPESFLFFFKGISWRHWWTIGNTVMAKTFSDCQVELDCCPLFIDIQTCNSRYSSRDSWNLCPIWFRPLFYTLSNHSSTKPSRADWSTTFRKPTKSPVEQWCQATDSSPLKIGLPNRPTLHV